MKNTQAWLEEYGQSHRHPKNQMIHKICVPLIVWTVVALVWSIPWPFDLRANWALIFVFLTLIFYARLGFKPFAFMSVYAFLCLGLCYLLQRANVALFAWALGLFVVAWIFQFVGHKIEGQKPSFLKDLQFLLVGPLWVFKKLIV